MPIQYRIIEQKALTAEEQFAQALGCPASCQRDFGLLFAGFILGVTFMLFAISLNRRW